MGKRTRTVLIAMLTACLCLALAVGGTYALFSDSAKVENHLQAGSLDVGLRWVKYTEYTLAADGQLKESETDKDVDLSETTTNDVTLFSVTDAVPNSWYEAELEVSNQGNVAFDYGVRILLDTDSLTDLQKKFAEQITITVTATGVSKSFSLSEIEDVDLGTMAAQGTAQTFTVRATFTDSANNDEVQKQSLNFDLQVYANQSVGA